VVEVFKEVFDVLTSVAVLSVLGVVDLQSAVDPVLPVLVGEDDAQRERGVRDVVIEVILKKTV
jgi:hypothetical protein